MGYYDEDNQRRYQEQKGRKGGSFLSGLLGAVVGALLIIFTIPVLSNTGLLPYSVEPRNNADTTNQTGQNQSGAAKNVSVDVTSEVTKAVDKAGEAVVGITNIQNTSNWFGSSQQQEAGTGSGVIYKKQGDKAYVVSNHHVVEGASELEVSLNDGTKIPAKMIGSDPWTDLAVLEISSDKVKTVAEFGNSDKLKIGEPVIAIGNPLGLTFSGSVTQGIISGLERAIPVDINQDGTPDWQAQVIQTDAAINPGNSGGALVNIDGQVVGINSMKIAQTSIEGIGLSIPINSAMPVISDLEKFGEVKRPYMGISLSSVNEIPEHFQESMLQLPEDINYGVAIQEVQPNSPAAKAGLKALDVIVEMDGKKINDAVDLRKHLYNEKDAGDEMKVKFYRKGKLQEATMVLSQEELT
ncbi:S1C family serine protease [Mesobacillus foraminis]|uniref:Serine protease Do n=1 Tax=Mesobacillus foraminis TaxID=279826 RepID=A0A4R2BCF8_9BACI|nr:trypsin-like peptidase domain-containing protein [Mesobacillus foraminis]TCN23942.1 serine protease Do [Mesobacillus foraminis]